MYEIEARSSLEDKNRVMTLVSDHHRADRRSEGLLRFLTKEDCQYLSYVGVHAGGAGSVREEQFRQPLRRTVEQVCGNHGGGWDHNLIFDLFLALAGSASHPSATFTVLFQGRARVETGDIFEASFVALGARRFGNVEPGGRCLRPELATLPRLMCAGSVLADDQRLADSGAHVLRVETSQAQSLGWREQLEALIIEHSFAVGWTANYCRTILKELIPKYVVLPKILEVGLDPSLKAKTKGILYRECASGSFDLKMRKMLDLDDEVVFVDLLPRVMPKNVKHGPSSSTAKSPELPFVAKIIASVPSVHIRLARS
mmetsp:Transcript_28907/g.72600  ORF Transcript_28907/g.72600 Transcript_28907/m.72600 type:complete len:314 (+) Transcript_28907:1340-2281(+)